LFTAETASRGVARATLAYELDGAALGMISGDGALDDLSAFRTNRHERRPSGAILLAQSRRNDRGDLAMLGEDKFQRVVEASARVHLGSAHQLVLDFYRREKLAEQAYHVLGETRVTLAERIGNLRYRLAQVLGSRFAIRNVLGHFAEPVHVIDKNNQPRRPRRLEIRKRSTHIGGAHDFAHRAEMRESRRPEAALENYRP